MREHGNFLDAARLDGKYFSERQVSGHEADLRNLQS